MSNEETIKRIEETLKLTKLCQRTTNAPTISANYFWDMRTLLDLYNKEKRKNEELKTIIKTYDSLEGNIENKIIVFDKTSAMLNGKLFINRYICKDEIKEKIEELRKKTANVVTDEINEIIINVLNELLEE